MLLDLSAIARGQLCVAQDWLAQPLVASLRADILTLRDGGKFIASGLSNTARKPGAQTLFDERDRSTCTWQFGLGGDFAARHALDKVLEELRSELQAALGRSLALEEQYYSYSGPGTFLPRHMDERHEDLKGACAWESESRRSVSWLIYLSADGWDDPRAAAGAGGALRAFCRGTACDARCGAEDGNLQVGWLSNSRLEADAAPVVSNEGDARVLLAECDEPVFLDSWVRTPSSPSDEFARRWRPRSALYCVRRGARSYLTEPFGADALGLASSDGVEPHEFAATLATLLPAADRDRFSGVEVVPHAAQRVVDVSPRGGTLVLFDSVAVPHEVTTTIGGERLAVAGWFHEAQQPFPEWFGS